MTTISDLFPQELKLLYMGEGSCAECANIGLWSGHSQRLRPFPATEVNAVFGPSIPRHERRETEGREAPSSGGPMRTTPGIWSVILHD